MVLEGNWKMKVQTAIAKKRNAGIPLTHFEKKREGELKKFQRILRTSKNWIVRIKSASGPRDRIFSYLFDGTTRR